MIVTSDGAGDSIGHVLTLIAIAVGFVVLFIQYRSSLKLQKTNAREKLKLDVYSQGSECLFEGFVRSASH